MKRYRKTLFFIVFIIVFANTFAGAFKTFLDERHYRYSNYDGSVTFSEFMSRNFEMMKNRHKSCLLAHPDLKDKNIYRLFTKNPFAFWRWRLYFFDERYKLPYKSFEDIKKIRDKENIKVIQGCIAEF